MGRRAVSLKGRLFFPSKTEGSKNVGWNKYNFKMVIFWLCAKGCALTGLLRVKSAGAPVKGNLVFNIPAPQRQTRPHLPTWFLSRLFSLTSEL